MWESDEELVREGTDGEPIQKPYALASLRAACTGAHAHDAIREGNQREEVLVIEMQVQCICIR